MENNKLFIENVNTYLEKALFDRNNINKESVESSIEQNIEVVSCSEKQVVIRMSRSVSTSDSGNHILYVSAVAIFSLSNDSFKNFNDLKEMNEYVKRRSGFLVDKIQMGAELTKIIANLTGNFGNPPLILPPVINDKTMNKSQNKL